MKDGFYKIKTWEQMEKEFTLDSDGDIDFSPSTGFFTADMEKEMSYDRIIEIRGGMWKKFYAYREMIKCYLGNPRPLFSEEEHNKNKYKGFKVMKEYNLQSTSNLFNSKFICSEEDKSGIAIFEEGETKYEIYLKEYLDYFRFQDLLNKAVKYGRSTMALEFKNKMEQTIVDIEKDI
jgi:hypothetical protein